MVWPCVITVSIHKDIIYLTHNPQTRDLSHILAYLHISSINGHVKIHADLQKKKMTDNSE